MKVPPHSIDAEEAVIGSILIDPNVLNLIMGEVSAEDFYLKKHQIIFGAIERLFDRGDPVDIVSICEELRKRNELDAVGGEVEVARLADAVPTSANAEFYARTVKEKSALRKLISASAEIVEMAYSPEDVETILDTAERKIFEITEMQTVKTYNALSSVLHNVFENLEKLKLYGGSITGIPTGFKLLDHMTTGFHPSDFVVIAGRPSMGKTAFALSIARNMAVRQGIPVGIFSLEMSKEQLVQRILSSESRVDLSKMRSGKLNDNDWDMLTTAAGRLYKSPIVVDDEPGLDPRGLRAKARRMKREFDIKVIFVDYLQLMHTKRQDQNRQQEISEISRSMKLLARELDIVVVALSQLSRAVEQREDKRPRLSDLRESGAIEQDADTVIFLYREAYYRSKKDEETLDEPHETEVIIGKQRNGPVGSFRIMFDPRYTAFADLEASLEV